MSLWKKSVSVAELTAIHIDTAVLAPKTKPFWHNPNVGRS
jgi:hypothetical protein